MLRSLALISLASSSLLWFGCSNNDTPIKYPPILMPDMSDDGTGGNGGTGGTGGGGGGGSTGDNDMSSSGGAQDMGPTLPDLAGLPAPDRIADAAPAASDDDRVLGEQHHQGAGNLDRRVEGR